MSDEPLYRRPARELAASVRARELSAVEAIQAGKTTTRSAATEDAFGLVRRRPAL